MVARRRASKLAGRETQATWQLSPERGALDDAAFERMVLAYAQPLTSFAWRYVRSDDMAVDIVQDVFAQVWERGTAIDQRTNMRAYLFAATRNRALNVLAHGRIEERWRVRAAREEGDGEDGPTAPHASELAERRELSAAIAAALRSLPPRAQEIARLRWIEHLSRREIAEVLGIALPTVSIHLTRTVKRLRALLRGFAP